MQTLQLLTFFESALYLKSLSMPLRLMFLMGCAVWGLKTLPISKDFCLKKWLILLFFFRNFRKLDPFLEVFQPRKQLILLLSFSILGKIFWTKMGHMSRICCEKLPVINFQGTSPYTITCEYPQAYHLNWSITSYKHVLAIHSQITQRLINRL